MNYTLKNQILTVEISDYGAEIQSIKSNKTGVEYLWQGSDVYWKNRATVIFPICGRLHQGKYTYNGKEYQMIIHGFAKKSTFTVVEQSNEKIVFQLKANDFTREQYPFEFILNLEYELDNNELKQTYRVFNPDDKTLIFSIGGHPGFNVPFIEGERFEDYYLEFDSVGEKLNSFFSDDGLTLPKSEYYPMVDGKIINLTHGLFDNDAIFLDDKDDAVTLKSKTNSNSVRVEFKDMTKIGFWQDERTEAPFLCIEPWHGIPADDGVTDDLSTKKQMIHLKPNEEYSTYFKIIIQE